MCDSLLLYGLGQGLLFYELGRSWSKIY